LSNTIHSKRREHPCAGHFEQPLAAGFATLQINGLGRGPAYQPYQSANDLGVRFTFVSGKPTFFKPVFNGNTHALGLIASAPVALQVGDSVFGPWDFAGYGTSFDIPLEQPKQFYRGTEGVDLGTLLVNIEDPQGDPISGLTAGLPLGGAEAVTDAAGQAEFQLPIGQGLLSIDLSDCPEPASPMLRIAGALASSIGLDQTNRVCYTKQPGGALRLELPRNEHCCPCYRHKQV
jgi:hypothetical protein